MKWRVRKNGGNFKWNKVYLIKSYQIQPAESTPATLSKETSIKENEREKKKTVTNNLT